MLQIIIRLDNLSEPAVQALLAEHLDNMRRLSPLESVHALAIEELRRPEIKFWTAWSDNELLGCGALKELDHFHGEIKAMRTTIIHQRKGVARKILIHII